MPQSQQHIAENSSQVYSSDSVMVLSKNANDFSQWNFNPLELPTLLETEVNLPPLPFSKKTDNDTFPLFYLYFGIVLIWAFFYRNNFKTIKNIGESFISNTALNQLLHERRSFNGFVSIGVFLLGLLVISTFSFLAIQYNYPEVNTNLMHDSKAYIFLILASLITLTFAKSVIIGISSWLFAQQSSFTGYLSLNVNSIQILGIILLPLGIILTYSHSVNPMLIVVLGTSSIVLVFLYRIVRTFFLAVKETNSQVFHIILYICALEILPLFIAGKLLFG